MRIFGYTIHEWKMWFSPDRYCPDGRKHDYIQDGYYSNKVCDLCGDTRPGDVLPRVD